MTVEGLKKRNQLLRRQLRDTRGALRDAEDTIKWVGKELKRTAGTKRKVCNEACS